MCMASGTDGCFVSDVDGQLGQCGMAEILERKIVENKRELT